MKNYDYNQAFKDALARYWAAPVTPNAAPAPETVPVSREPAVTVVTETRVFYNTPLVDAHRQYSAFMSYFRDDPNFAVLNETTDDNGGTHITVTFTHSA